MKILPLFSASEVRDRIQVLSARLYRDYADSPLSIVCIAEGASRFAEALASPLEKKGVPFDQHLVRARRPQGAERGGVQVDAFDPGVLEDRDVLVVADVVDEGAKLRAVLDLVELADTRTVRTAVLVRKGERGRASVGLDYVGFDVESGWVVGFGMDLEGECGDLDEIALVSDEP
ncbi:MAG: phosphoribosyltransferase family protein [Myxococcota bacterium]